MAAYYQRQRLPQPTLSFLEDLESPPPSRPSHQHPEEETSFLIFPSPTARPTQHPRTPSPASPTESTTSLPASLVVSVAQRSERSDSRERVASLGSRSESREGLNIANDWDEIRGPLPRPRLLSPSFQARPRAINRLSSYSSNGALRSPLTPLSEVERETLERHGSGWEWTLDKEDASTPTDLVLSWQRMSMASSSDGDPLDDVHTTSYYEDAASHFPHDPERTLIPESGALGLRKMRSQSSEARSGKGKGTAVRHKRSDLLQNARQRGYSLRLRGPPGEQPRTQPAPRGQASNQNQRFTLPLGTLIQAIFDIEQDTIDLIEQHHTGPEPPSIIYNIPDDVVGAETPRAETPRSLTKEEQHDLRMAYPDTPGSLDRSLLQGFRATHLIPTNPFVLPLYLIGLGWTHAFRGMAALTGSFTDNHLESYHNYDSLTSYT